MDCKIRTACVSLLGTLCTNNSINNASAEEVKLILQHFLKDDDPRVRKAAFHALYIIHQKGHSLNIELYQQAVKVLSDDFEEVRQEGLKLIWY